MSANTFTFTSHDGVEIVAKKWETDQANPKAVVQIAHGMAEHIQRYEDFAKYLVKHHVAVYGNDHRGHGLTGQKMGITGYFADEDGFDKVVGDMMQLTNIIKTEHPGVPVFLFGHSMGSFLARRYIQLYGDQLQGVILSGTGGDPGLLGKLGKLVAQYEIRNKGRKTPSPLLNKLTFGSFNKRFKPNRTAFDWLTRDEREVDKYIEDPLCGGICTAGFFYDLFHGLQVIHDQGQVAQIPKDLPLLFISGDQDPVGKQGKGVLAAVQMYKRAGLKHVSYKLYKDGRHEILNELNRQDVYADIVSWLEEQLEQINSMTLGM
ncbi:alpha/beta hydrolase [Caldalkalibacillus thermarum]|uniref:alpha/beta hydrolase n=1 Tax=Caldalkalibacillus thermarum TaxID=296745 RepID=UPI0016631EFA|nr:alpha/beta hydrolase [Caldalkalibacillus thermarum]GGK30926.1 alpha/beta hydrolase [Caldalkalibacillus thermarum]